MALPALGPALPELILAVGALVLLLVGAFQGERCTRLLEGARAAAAGGRAGAGRLRHGTVLTFNGGFIADGFGRFARC